MPARLDHVTIAAPDVARCLAFYDASLGALGLTRLDELVDEEEDDAPVEAAAWGPFTGPAFLWLVTGPAPTTAMHVSLRADAPSEVEDFYRAALEHGGRAHAAPRRWTLYRRGRFRASVHDPLGNLIEVVAPE